MHRPAWYIGALLVAAAVVAGVVCLAAGGEAAVTVIETHPIAPGEAIVTLRDEGDEARHHWLQSVAIDGSARWSVDLHDRVPVATLGTSAILATGERVFALLTPAASGHATRLMAIERASGKRLWEVGVDASVGDDVVTVTADALLADDERVYVARAVGREARVDAFTLDGGAHVWSAPLDATNVRLRALDGERLLATPRVGAGQAIDRATGVATPRGWGVYLGEIGGAVAIGQMTSFSVIGLTGEPARYDVTDEYGVESRAPIGVFGERWIVAGLRVLATNAVAIGGFDRGAKALAWTIDLGRLLFAERASDGGALPRFVAVGVHGRPTGGKESMTSPPLSAGGDGKGDALVVVDLAEGKVVWDTALDTTRFEAFDARGRAWVWLEEGTLVAIDPVSGGVQRATAFAGIAANAVVNEEAVRYGQLWLRGDATAARDEAPLVVVDLASGLVVLRRGDIAVTDVTAMVRAAFGAP
ncbi:MAG: PQQ-binding-like beta-propeller repeat protein [Myxococcales bacterium]|nr:PQQ-binding-like beta-propeller repeat protein [Myxococcales bacterium]